MIGRTFSRIETVFGALFYHSGSVLLLFVHALTLVRATRNDLRRLLRQMVSIGVNTLPLALMIGLFTGLIFSLNMGIPLEDFGVEDRIGSILGVALVRELAPVFTAIILAARVGAAMTAEIGTMSVSAELDSLRVMGVNPTRFLAMPRIVASLIMNPLLTVYSTAAGLIGGQLLSHTYFGIPASLFWERVFQEVTMKEINTGLLKALVFGALYSTICVHFGMTCQNGAQGVGQSTTRAVVASLTMILIADFLLTRALFG